MLKPSLLFILLGTFLPATSLAGGDSASGKIKAYTCTGCHGIPGYKNTYPMYKVPKIGGQNEEYLITAMSAYRSGNRSHPTMMLQAESLGSADIDDIAAWLSSLERQSTGTSRAVPEPDRTATCHACHGSDGVGTNSSYPVLAGQHESYIIHALEDYRNGKRKNAVMIGFASDLSDQDIEDLAYWYSSLQGLTDLSGH